MESKIYQWIINSIENINKGDFTQSIHIDEFITKNELSSPNDILTHSIEIWNLFCENMNKIDLKEIQLFLQIGLEENEGQIQGVPMNEGGLVKSIDDLEMPEIFLYKPYDPFYIPMAEFYRSPLPFDVTRLNDKTKVFYKEYRSLDDLKVDEAFTRELNFVFYP